MNNDARWLDKVEHDPALADGQWCGARLATRAEVKSAGFHPAMAGVVWGVRLCGSIHRLVLVSLAQDLTLETLLDQERRLRSQLQTLVDAVPSHRSLGAFAVLQHMLPEITSALRRCLCPISCRRIDCAGQFNGPFTDGLPVASTIARWVAEFNELDTRT